MSDHPVLNAGIQVLRTAVPADICELLASEVLTLQKDSIDDRAYWEVVDGTPRIYRVERFTEVFSKADRLLTVATSLASDAFGGSVVLMKDKLNVKWPKGGGYRCHQDSRAYPPTMGTVLTVGIALTPADERRGGLWLAEGVGRLLDSDERGCVSAVAQSGLDFTCPALAPGDAVLFSGYTPHYSGENRSQEPRSLALITFVEGGARTASDIRSGYYQWRKEVLEGLGAEQRASELDDFTGVLPDS
jgi:ectoine hydroxylase-related dioxygenase (phytanoyl-CoA dioxygenase family)